jgi:hypothetical protein
MARGACSANIDGGQRLRTKKHFLMCFVGLTFVIAR